MERRFPKRHITFGRDVADIIIHTRCDFYFFRFPFFCLYSTVMMGTITSPIGRYETTEKLSDNVG